MTLAQHLQPLVLLCFCHYHQMHHHHHQYQLATTAHGLFHETFSFFGKSNQNNNRYMVGLPDIMVKRCAMQLAEALDFMHSKALVHRDVKLDNILLFDKDCHCIKLADFGLTRLEGFNISPLKGTVPYSSPELCVLEENDTLELDSSLDVWAFGILLFCISTGYFPWDTASYKDSQYEQFALWQTTGNYQKIPYQWKQFTWRALDMFQKLLALNAVTRSPAIEVQKYLSDPWKINSLKDNCNLQDN
ncbi:unnamed protein product, partial [Ranitomeya imitator]